MAIKIAEKWLADSARTASAHDYAAHMNLISKKVALTGIPGYEVIDYDSWAAQCKDEFENKLIKSVRYDGLRMVAESPKRIMFRTFETVEATDGKINAQGIEIVIDEEEDGQWRLVQERVLSDDEAGHHNLIPKKH
jgi:hypothetical protein